MSLIRGRRHTVAIVGLDKAGKTTLVNSLSEGRFREGFSPTVEKQEYDVEVEPVWMSLLVQDQPGNASFRQHWELSYPTAHAIIFVVDAADAERLEEASKELDKLLSAEWLSVLHIPILVLGNKIDLPDAVTEDQLQDVLKITSLVTGKDASQPLPPNTRPLETFMISLKSNVGYAEAFAWLDSHLSATGKAIRHCKSSCTLF